MFSSRRSSRNNTSVLGLLAFSIPRDTRAFLFAVSLPIMAHRCRRKTDPPRSAMSKRSRHAGGFRTRRVNLQSATRPRGLREDRSLSPSRWSATADGRKEPAAPTRSVGTQKARMTPSGCPGKKKKRAPSRDAPTTGNVKTGATAGRQDATRRATADPFRLRTDPLRRTFSTAIRSPKAGRPGSPRLRSGQAG